MKSLQKKFVALWGIVALLVMLTPMIAEAAVPAAPTGLTATAATRTSVMLSWTASSGATDYWIEYSADQFLSTTVTFVDGVSTATTATVTGLTNGITYSFRVKAANAEGIGSASTAIMAITGSALLPNDLPVYTACPTVVVPAHSFVDIFHTQTSVAVNCISYYGITKGTTATTYSPNDPVTRWQMALFLTRMAAPAGVTLGDGSDQGFTDIGGKSTEIQTAINQLKQLGITVGTNAAGTLFDPDSNVTREEMALFISRLLKDAITGPGGNEEYVTGTTGTKEIKSGDTDHNFTDIDNINLTESRTAVISLWNLGVTDDSTATTYEPSASMTRAAMAMFMATGLDHTNARPAGVNLQASTYSAAGDFLLNLSVTYRSAAFLPITNARMDTFKFVHTISTSSSRFTSAGSCAGEQSIAAGIATSLVCTIDSTDPPTDANGNVAIEGLSVPTGTTVDYWSWTGSLSETFDNDLHTTAANKITLSAY